MGYKWSAGDALLSDRLNKTGSGVLKIQAGEAIDTTSTPKAGYIGSDGKAYYSNASSVTDAKFDFVIMYGQNVSSGTDIYVIKAGHVSNFSGLTRGNRLFVGNTDGLIQNTQGTICVLVGRALSSTEIFADKYSNSESLIRGFDLNFVIQGTGNGATASKVCGYSDASDPVLTVSGFGSAAAIYGRAKIARDFGVDVYPISCGDNSRGSSSTSDYGALYIGADLYQVTNGSFFKNNSGLSISGTFRSGPLGHDVANSRILVLYDSTHIAKFTESGGTITNLASDVTLDNAVSDSHGFVYDETNDRFICVDTGDGVIRRFNSSGITVDTVPYTIDTTALAGLAIIDGRVYMVFITAASNTSATEDTQSINVKYIPTAMTIE